LQKELANILKGKLLILPFADLVAGLVQTLTTQEPSADNATTITTRRPVAYDVTIVGGDPCAGKEVALMPDSRRKSIIYFEDYGISTTGTLRGLTGYNSSLRLIAWLDRSKLVGDSYTEIAGRCQSAIVSILAHKNPENIGMFTRLQIDVAKIPPQDPALFGKYTYNETDRQYLRPPFEFFGIDFTCRFYVPEKCLTGIPWNVTACS
jgi:hypothetical protein